MALTNEDKKDVVDAMGKSVANKVDKVTNDRRKNAEPYKRGETPSSKSEYFGKSYGQLQRESKSVAKKMEMAKKMK